MVSPRLFETLDPEEQKLWHSHVYEVKSGMLFMPKPLGVPETVWLTAETKAMEEIMTLYGKTFHFWEIDKGDKLPLGNVVGKYVFMVIGMPKLMMSFTADGQVDVNLSRKLQKEVDGVSLDKRKEWRKSIPDPQIHPSNLCSLLANSRCGRWQNINSE